MKTKLFCTLLLVGLALSALVAAGRPLAEKLDLEQKFRRLDRDNDGKVTLEEANHAPWFALLDANGDGAITLEEAQANIGRLAEAIASRGPNKTESPTPERVHGPKPINPGEVGVGRLVPDVAFTDLAGKSHKLSEFQTSKGLIIAFTSSTCPVSKRYFPLWARMEKEWRQKGISLLLVNPFASEDATELRKASSSIESPYVQDRDRALTLALRARSTTEVFLLDPSRTLKYRGAIDDQYGADYSREAPLETYLNDAIAALLTGTRPLLAATEAPGCELDLPLANAGSAADVTYHRDVSRILQQNCAECHHEGGIAPFSLNDLEEVKDRARVIRRVVESGTMPPWFAAPPAAGQPSPWANERVLSARDKADLLGWISSTEKPLGDPAQSPLPLVSHDGWNIGTPDLIFQIPEPVSVPAEGVMPYQVRIVTSTLEEDRWVQGYEIRPTAPGVVHHVIVQVHPKGSKLRGIGGEGDGGYWAAYVPGNSSHVFPDGVARKLPAGATISFQIHYTPSGKATQDQLQLGIIFAKTPPRFAAQTVSVAKHKLDIPPGVADHVEVAEQKAPFDLHVTAFVAHMHVRGKSFRYEVTYPDGRNEVLLDIPHYDFNWQLRYEYKQEHFIPRGSLIKITAVFDNSAQNKANPDPSKTVHWGDQTFNEMMIGYIEHYVPIAQPIAAANP